MPAQEDRGGIDALPLRNLYDRLCRQQRTARAAERAVCSDVNALLVAEVDGLLLGETGVVLNLVDGWDHVGVGEKLLEIGSAVVANTNRLGLAAPDQLLHTLPGGDVGVVQMQVTRAIWEGRDVGVISFAASICA